MSAIIYLNGVRKYGLFVYARDSIWRPFFCMVVKKSLRLRNSLKSFFLHLFTSGTMLQNGNPEEKSRFGGPAGRRNALPRLLTSRRQEVGGRVRAERERGYLC